MKTKQLQFIIALMLCVFFSGISSAQSLFDNGETPTLDPLSTIKPVDLRTYNLDMDSFGLDYNISEAPKSITENDEAAQVAAVFATYMVALGGGFGFGNDETLYCLHAAFYMRLALLANSALYGSFGVVYSGLSADNFTQSLIDFQLKFMMFTAITKYKQVFFLYGLMAAYGIGTDKYNDSINYDITRLTVALVLGLSIILTTQWSLMLQTNVLAFQDWKQKYDGNETSDSNTFGIINKNNIFAISLVYMLANSRR